MKVQVELNDAEKIGATIGNRASDSGIEVVVDLDYEVFMGSFFKKMGRLAKFFRG